jgi:hypothetical protein
VKGLLAHEMTPKKRKKLDPKLLHDFLLYKSRTPEQRDLLESHFVEKKQVGGKEKDPLSTFRPMTNLEEEDSLEDYSALIGLGISQKDLQGKNKHVKEALLKHIEAIRRLHDNEVDISSILNLSTSDLIKVLENVDSLIVMLWKGVTLPTFLKIITSSKKSKSTLGDKK